MGDGLGENRSDATLIKAREENGDHEGKGSYPDPARAPSAAESSTKTEMWPEQPDPTKFWIYQVYERWTYSYMSPLLKKGARQTLDDGTHLSSNDLHPIPESMKSSNLSQRFWYVC
jgi:hypothetical protein